MKVKRKAKPAAGNGGRSTGTGHAASTLALEDDAHDAGAKPRPSWRGPR